MQKYLLKQRNQRICIIASSLVFVGILFLIFGLPYLNYNSAVNMYKNGNFDNAIVSFEKLGKYKDSEEMIVICEKEKTNQIYEKAIVLYESGDFCEAVSLFNEISDYKDSSKYKRECNIALVKELEPQFFWDFSNNLNEYNGISTKIHGDVELSSVIDKNLEKAAYFDGDGDFIDCGNGFNIDETFSFSTVLCCEDVNKEYSAFFAKYEHNGGSYAFSIRDGHINCWLTSSDGEEVKFETETRIESNEWYHIAIIKDYTNMKIFINGKLEAEETVNDVVNSNDMVTIGRQALLFEPVEDLQFKGYINEISVYDEALSDEFVGVLCDAKINTDTVRTNIPENSLKFNSHYYAIFNNCSTWEEAEKYCETRGGHLATITSAEENRVVFNYLLNSSYDSAYFGFTDNLQEGNWKWCNNEKVNYTNWRNGEPNGENSRENYAMFYYSFEDGTWNDGDFGGSTVNGGKAFICEWEL